MAARAQARKWAGRSPTVNAVIPGVWWFERGGGTGGHDGYVVAAPFVPLTAVPYSDLFEVVRLQTDAILYVFDDCVDAELLEWISLRLPVADSVAARVFHAGRAGGGRRRPRQETWSEYCRHLDYVVAEYYPEVVAEVGASVSLVA